MDRIHNLLNDIQNNISSTTKITKAEDKTYDGKFSVGDRVTNINQSCIHYGSEGIVKNIEQLPDRMGQLVAYQTINGGEAWKSGDLLRKTTDQLANSSIQTTTDREPSIVMDGPETTNDLIAEDINSPESELIEYKEDFYEMSVGSLKAISTHSTSILNSLDNPSVKENLTESWLQGKIAVTEDYMRTIHDFIMYVSEAADTILAADRPGLWENIRKKKDREGKKYKPAKPGDSDRPSPEQWKKLTK
jgi:hypothetical protein